MRRHVCRELVMLMEEEEEKVEEEVEAVPVLARDERKRTLHRLIQIIIDFMIETHEY